MIRASILAGLGILVLGGTLALTLGPSRAVAPAGAGAPARAPGPTSAPAADRASTPRWTGSFVKPPEAELKKRLTPLQYQVTQEAGTERAFSNEYWDEHRDGIYVDIVSGEPLFSSKEKYDSGTGWPSFWKPLEQDDVKIGADLSFLQHYAEVRSAHADSHLGHVFHDGPPPTGLRFCMNSASMRFIPAADLEKDGYGKYAALFAGTAK